MGHDEVYMIGTCKRCRDHAPADLLALEEVVAERAVSLRSETVDGILGKLRLWRRLESDEESIGAEDGRASVRDRLVLSVEADLSRIARSLN